MKQCSKTSKTLRAKELGVSRQGLYYQLKKPHRDWQIKCQIEEILQEHPSYGSRRLALHMKMNRKKVNRVMNLYGIKPYRRRGRTWKKTKKTRVIYPNLLFTNIPIYPNHIWVADFTYIPFHGTTIYLATVMDVYTRTIVGLAVYTTHAVQLILSAFMNAIHNHSRPMIFHSDNGSEYNSEIFIDALTTVGTSISRSAPGCPWENGYQESFYSQFKIDLGDPSRFKTLGELVYEIYQAIYSYNHLRIHSALKMAPVQFAQMLASGYNLTNKDGV